MNANSTTGKAKKLSQLQLFVWQNRRTMTFAEMATRLNRPLRSIEQAYNRAFQFCSSKGIEA